MSPQTRLVVVAVVTSIGLAIGGFGLEAARFGLDESAAALRLEQEVRRHVADQARRVETLARSVAADGAVVVEATASRDRLPALFDRLLTLAGRSTMGVSATVYVPLGPAGGYRVLAWSDGPAQDVGSDRLSGPSALFLAPGTAGVRLVFVHPVEAEGRRVGVVAAETVLSAFPAIGQRVESQLPSSFGPVEIVPQYAGAGEGPLGANAFLIAGDAGATLLEVRFETDQLARARYVFRRRALALAALPIVALVLLLTGNLLDRRRRARDLRSWLTWTIVVGVLVGLAAVMLAGLSALVDAPPATREGVLALTAIALAALGPVSWWWRRPARPVSRAKPGRFIAEQIAAGLFIAAAIVAATLVLRARITAASLDRWQFPLFPVDWGGMFYLTSVLLIELAIAWTTAAVVATIAARWHVVLRRPARAGVAIAIWLLPTVGVLVAPHALQPLSTGGSLVAAVAVAIFALFATAARRYYRHTTQAMRMLVVFAALLIPPLVLYPIATFTADRTARALIEQEYAPATAQHPRDLIAQLGRARQEIDRMPLPTVSPDTNASVDSRIAFHIWSQTALSRSRATSDVELYGENRTLVSRFALNMPEYVYRATAQTWQGTSCTWEVFGEVTRFGADDRRMLHAERGICDETGRIRGAVVVHVAQSDFQALPFVVSGNPYYEVLGAAVASERPSRLSDLQVVTYGWGLQPNFTSGRVAWPIDDAIFRRLYDHGEPFWTTLPADGRTYQVHFSQDRRGIYALGVPLPSLFEHAARLSEIAAITAVLFVLLQIGATAYAPVARRRVAPLRVLFDEIRTSFYRKLFLFFVLAAVGPVLVFALAFGEYMTGKFRADVESEATSVVRVARRVFEELAAAEQKIVPTDDAMVWIRQVIDQDVNLFRGSELVATSRRDLFDSGLLPTRTPAPIYRAIALSRLPTYVTEDRLGTFRYLVAAAPVSAEGPDTVLSVPLALRQREIEREIDELNRRVLVGAMLVLIFAAGLGASVAGRVSDPVARLTRATRLIAEGRLDVQVATDTADELRRLVDDFNSMAGTLLAQRAELARTNQLKAWNEMARQVAHEIKNPLTPIQLAAEHLQRVHEDKGRPLGSVFDQCVTTVLQQVRLLRRIASEFANFAGEPAPRLEAASLRDVMAGVLAPYEIGLAQRVTFVTHLPADLPDVRVDRTLVSRALTNLIENAIQAMPGGGTIRVDAAEAGDHVRVTVADSGVGMDADALRHAFEPYFSTKTAGSGLGLANARRYIELCGGTIAIDSTPGAGVTATVTLPLAARPGAGAVASPPAR